MGDLKRFKFLDTPGAREYPVLDEVTHQFSGFFQTEPNLFRKVTQALDLITLDLDYARFKKVRLSLAVLLIGLLISYNVL
jgi:hypothetical protein